MGTSQDPRPKASGVESSHSSRWLVSLAVLYAVADKALLRTPMLAPALHFHGLKWNWVGKALSFLFICLLLVWSRWLRHNIGLRWRQAPGSLRLSVVGFLACILAGIVEALPIHAEAFSLETLLFQAFVPSIQEELAFRGIMLSLFEKAFGHSPMSCQMRFGWAALITSVMFGLAHLPDVSGALWAAAIGSILALVRTRSGSLLWPMLCHTASNLPYHAVAMML